jgi:hypothetical protein
MYPVYKHCQGCSFLDKSRILDPEYAFLGTTAEDGGKMGRLLRQDANCSRPDKERASRAELYLIRLPLTGAAVSFTSKE